MATPEDQERYREELLVLIGSFEFERCSECGKDVDRHTFAPDPLGHPHQYCLDETRHAFELRFETDNAAFDDGYGGHSEISRILWAVAERNRCEDVDGRIRDINGNVIGEWRNT